MPSSIFFNKRMLDLLEVYRTKTELGKEVVEVNTDEWSLGNGMGDVWISIVQMIIWWSLLLLLKEKYIFKFLEDPV